MIKGLSKLTLAALIGCSGWSMISAPQAHAADQEKVTNMSREFLQNDQYVYNGYRVKEVGKPAIYLVDRGMKRHITDPDTYNRIFKNRDGILEFQSLHTIPNGRSIDQDMGLVRFENDSFVYFLDKDATGKPMKRWIKSPSILNKYAFHSEVSMLPQWMKNAIPNGAAIR
ncbi:hypothetical protein [Bacillus thuringiensis]|uniref:Uncharacterized protein n=1 Tax=Bacillus thuringiensis DB27 TaxID=1431339 RepID=W8YD83_BACTU|nr:hypothetical protein [Bacillus thuringiensis]MBG9633514.1 hypothetical protein [Bacillus thuringiensis]MBG9668011.1 hypothetical protein [Bacillus thuringiensis]MBH0355326.1 hypothetical protein [Bacillus thuringiensis]CDN39474.1 unnamed protein product [Bacillus thuringiensis DB27]